MKFLVCFDGAIKEVEAKDEIHAACLVTHDDYLEVLEHFKTLDDYCDVWFEAGIELKGTEIKSIRKGSANLKDCFVRIKDHEAFIENMYIAPYENGNIFNHEPRRIRKLLLHKKEISKLEKKVREDGLTIVPTKLYFNTSKAKLEIALAKGKKLYDKRNDLKEKDAKRDIEKALKRAY